MREVSELDAERIASTFRPNRRPLQVAVLANALLAIALLGWPYLRGRALAHEARRHFADLSMCLMGGQRAAHPGLSLPRGDRDHFAGKVMLAGPSWPLACRPVLQRLAPEPKVFLWPSVKQAGMDLRAAAELADRELADLDARRKAGLTRVPERLLQALRRVQAATVLLARAGGADDELDNDALVWSGPARLAVPARLPLMASDDALLDLYSTGTALEALALDGRGVSYLRVADGKVDRERVRRTSFVRGMLRSAADAYLVWAMPDARCAEREDHCAGRPTGLSPYDKGAAALKDPTWKLGGHPAGRIDRSLRLTASGHAWLLARAAADGGKVLLGFQIPPVDPAGPLPAGTLEASEHYEVGAAAPTFEAGLIPGSDPAAVLALRAESAGGELEAKLIYARAQRPQISLPAVQGEHPWTIGCAAAQGMWLAYGSDSQLRVVRVDGPDATPRELAARELRLPGALHGEDPALDRVRMSCSDDRAQLLWVSADRKLWSSSCAADSCTDPRSLAAGVSSFAALHGESGSVIALGAPLEAVRVLRLDAQQNPLGAPQMPSACFEPSAGLCGTPSLVADAQRIVLSARDRSDLLALESTDGGKSFATLSGLAGAAATIDQSTTSPLEQHRARKGLAH
jgi:hypothetical protein